MLFIIKQQEMTSKKVLKNPEFVPFPKDPTEFLPISKSAYRSAHAVTLAYLPNCQTGKRAMPTSDRARKRDSREYSEITRASRNVSEQFCNYQVCRPWFSDQSETVSTQQEVWFMHEFPSRRSSLRYFRDEKLISPNGCSRSTAAAKWGEKAQDQGSQFFGSWNMLPCETGTHEPWYIVNVSHAHWKLSHTRKCRAIRVSFFSLTSNQPLERDEDTPSASGWYTTANLKIFKIWIIWKMGTFFLEKLKIYQQLKIRGEKMIAGLVFG